MLKNFLLFHLFQQKDTRPKKKKIILEELICFAAPGRDSSIPKTKSNPMQFLYLHPFKPLFKKLVSTSQCQHWLSSVTPRDFRDTAKNPVPLRCLIYSPPIAVAARLFIASTCIAEPRGVSMLLAHEKQLDYLRPSTKPSSCRTWKYGFIMNRKTVLLSHISILRITEPLLIVSS